MTHKEKDELIFGLALLLEQTAFAVARAWDYGYMDGKMCMLDFVENRRHTGHAHWPPSLPALLEAEGPPIQKIGTP